MKLSPISGQSLHPLLRECGQLLLAIGDGSQHITGELLRFEKEGTAWRQVGTSIPCVFGKNGWAMGMKKLPLHQSLPEKKEGDQKTPMGLFSLGTAYGYAPRQEADFTKMPYLALNEHIKAVDDPASRFYNQVIDTRLLDFKDWNSAEDMKRNDDLYKWGIIINYNTSNIDPRAGSCIYLHLWRNDHTGTAGCTAMAERDFLDVMKWLDPSLHPAIVQAPKIHLSELLALTGLTALS